MVSPKKQDFWPRINICTQRKFFFKNPLMSKSAKIVLPKSIFTAKNQLNFFQKKSFRNINLGDHFLGATLLSEIMPNF